MASSERTVRPALTFKGSLQLLTWDLSQKRPRYKCINTRAALLVRTPLAIWPFLCHPDLAFETCPGMAVLLGNLCTCSQFICMEGTTIPLPALGRQAENLHSTSHTFSGLSGHPVLSACPSAHLTRWFISALTPSPSFMSLAIKLL